MPTSAQTDDEILSGAMDVFNTSGQNSSGNSGAQGQQDSTSILDHTVSGTQRTTGGTRGSECGNAGTAEPGLDPCSAQTTANSSVTGETGAAAGTTSDQSSASAEQGTGGTDKGTGQTTAGTNQGTTGTENGTGQTSAGTNQGTTGTYGSTGQTSAGNNQGTTGSYGSTGQTSAGNNQGTTGAYGSGQTSAGNKQGTTGGNGQTQAGNLPGNTGYQNGGTGRRIIVMGSGSPVVTDQERVEVLDRELDESMGVFDGVILSRRQEVIARTNETGAGQMQTGNGGTDGMGGEGAFGAESSSNTPPILTTASRDPNNMKTRGTLPDAESDNRKGEYQNGGSLGDNIPADISDGSDDDIVARQLREAAMQEKDPVLQEKLWNEYRKYKEGIQAKK